VVLAFGDHRLDIGRRELRRGAELIELEPKAFDLLVFLVQNRNRVVSKEDLLRAVWSGRFVSESALTTRINAVRRALGDDGAMQRFVRTFIRKGIRFVGEVTELPDMAAPSGSHAPPLPDKPSIAVLPFQNLSGDPEQDYFADGMVEEITTAVFERHARAVAAVFQAQESGMTLAELDRKGLLGDKTEELRQARRGLDAYDPHYSRDVERAYRADPELAHEAAGGNIRRAVQAMRLEGELRRDAPARAERRAAHPQQHGRDGRGVGARPAGRVHPRREEGAARDRRPRSRRQSHPPARDEHRV
jgi:DNA-binding winged helix-turn-helix (wHTH) protein